MGEVEQPALIGAAMARAEDARLITGRGAFLEDVQVEDAVHAHVLRSDVAHGRLLGIDVSRALTTPGVLAVYTARDMPGRGSQTCALPLTNIDGSPMRAVAQPVFATGHVRYVGEPLAMVVAMTLETARTAAERIDVRIESLSAVTTAEEALLPAAPEVHPDVPGNLVLDWQSGDASAVGAALAAAAHVVRLRLVNNRVVVGSLEPRGAIGRHDPSTGRFTLDVGCQGVFGMRGAIASLLGVDPNQVRVCSGDVGGSFGMKAGAYPEYVAVLLAARELGRPVRWHEDRSEAFLADCHGRASVFDCTLALAADGEMLAARLDGLADLGAYVTATGPFIPTLNIVRNFPGPYRLPALQVRTRCVVTNTTPVAAYRGAGRPEAVYFMERLLDVAALRTGIDRITLRRRNMITPAELPYPSVSGLTIDSGEFPAVLAEATATADLEGFERRRRDSASRGRLRGVGVASYLEATAPPNPEMAEIRFDANGRVSLVTGTLDYGQGHATAFSQVLADRLGISPNAVDLAQKDSDRLVAGGGTGGSRSIIASGNALLRAADLVIEKARRLAAHLFEADPRDIEFRSGHVRVAGTDRSIGLLDLAERIRRVAPPPELPQELDSSVIDEGQPSTCPNGCHVAEVEIDPETGVCRILGYLAVDDFGVIINPMLVEGQLHGGIVQGIGQALGERVAYARDGTPMTASFLDYSVPRAASVPAMRTLFRSTPAKTNALGVKGCGEAGVVGALPAVMNAICDALRPLGIEHVDMPATPERIWAAIRARRDGTQGEQA